MPKKFSQHHFKYLAFKELKKNYSFQHRKHITQQALNLFSLHIFCVLYRNSLLYVDFMSTAVFKGV
jgi:hypothetical protein